MQIVLKTCKKNSKRLKKYINTITTIKYGTNNAHTLSHTHNNNKKKKLIIITYSEVK